MKTQVSFANPGHPAAARLWLDSILDPAKTRDVLMLALEAASLNPVVAKFNVVVLQT